MTNSFISDFDAMAHAVFLAAGMADYAIYTPAEGDQPSVMCRVLVDRAVAANGFATEVLSPAVTIRVLLADIGALPRTGAIFQIGDERFVVDREPDLDEGLIACLVSREVRP